MQTLKKKPGCKNSCYFLPNWLMKNKDVIKGKLGVGVTSKTKGDTHQMFLKCLRSEAFLDALQNQAEASSSIIVQFGVGFYSAFMLADKVDVYSQSAEPGAPGYKAPRLW
uniref:Uncharacterized protein n=1 Tax=Sinocyclocheilus grahami TaxID=75366 RepID=A0A672NFH1_SINGR